MALQDGISRRALLAAATGVSIVGLAGCGAQRAEPARGPGPNTLYAVGDSLTEGNSPDFANRRFGDRSWVFHLDPSLRVLGGWARGGATSDDMLGGVVQSAADTLVLLAGANDVGSLPFEKTAQNLAMIATVVGAARVVVSTLPPRDDQPEVNVQFNDDLAILARDAGWHLVDPMIAVREGAQYKAGMTSDGIHPTVSGAAAIGRAMSELLRELP